MIDHAIRSCEHFRLIGPSSVADQLEFFVVENVKIPSPSASSQRRSVRRREVRRYPKLIHFNNSLRTVALP